MRTSFSCGIPVRREDVEGLHGFCPYLPGGRRSVVRNFLLMKTEHLLSGVAALCGGTFQAIACTGISLTAADGAYVQARTIEWAQGPLRSDYVVVPRGERLRSFTPTGADGLSFAARYGVVGLTVAQPEFIAEGINEAGLSAGLFFFPRYGGYADYDPAEDARTLADLQVVAWMLARFATIDEVREAIGTVRIIGMFPGSVLHWRIGEPSGRQVVLEIVDGVPHFYENEVGVLTNAPGFPWQLTNLDNYVNLRPGDASPYTLRRAHAATDGQQFGFSRDPGRCHAPFALRAGRLSAGDGAAAPHGFRYRDAVFPPAQQFRHPHRYRASPRQGARHSERDAVDFGRRPDRPQGLL